MAPVVWGLDLAEIKWSKFKSSYMWNNDYHLRKTKFVIYQCAMIFCVVSESLGTAVLDDYTSGQRHIESISKHTQAVANDDYVGAASYNIFAGVFVATIFGAAFFFDLIWPERVESRSVRIAWKVCGVLAVIFHLASAFAITIITAKHQSHVTDVQTGSSQREHFWWNQYRKHSEAPLNYSKNPRAIAAVVFAWVGTCFVTPSCVLLFLSINNIENGPGPKSKGARERDAEMAKTDPDLQEKAGPGPEPDDSHIPRTPTDGAASSAPVAESR